LGATLLASRGVIPDTKWLTAIPAAGAGVAGLLMTLLLYGFPGIRRLAAQLLPCAVGRAWPALDRCNLALQPRMPAIKSSNGVYSPRLEYVTAHRWRRRDIFLLGQGYRACFS